MVRAGQEPLRYVGFLGCALAAALSAQAPPQKFVPEPTRASDLTLKLERVGAMSSHDNPTSPTVAGSSLLLIDQERGIYRWTGSMADPLITSKSLPPGLKLGSPNEGFLNVAANAKGDIVYVMFIAESAPRGVPKRNSPRAQSDAWYVLYSFSFDGTTLTQPRAITALEARSDGHIGGGLLVLDDGSVLFTPGDNGDSYEDGWTNAQDRTNHLAKIMRIDPASGIATVVAVGVRNCQRLTLDRFDDGARVSFVDPGGWVAEEFNSVRVDDLMKNAPLNFGWGRTATGPAREGTLFIDKIGNSIGRVPTNDPGFIDPIADVGRESSPVFALSGPVHSASSLPHITWLAADLVSGTVYAVTGAPSATRQPVHRVSLVDAQGAAVTFKSLQPGASRADPRFFNFPDGSAGVLLEHSGAFYRISEVR